jgi:hypothetical protein
VPSYVPGGVAGRRAVYMSIQTALDNASAIRVCRPGRVAFQRADMLKRPEYQLQSA